MNDAHTSDVAAWIGARFAGSFSLVPGVYEMEGKGYSLRPGGNAELAELRTWAAQEAAKATADVQEIRIVAHLEPRSNRVLAVETYDLIMGTTAAYRQHYRLRLFGGKARVDGPLERVDAPPRLPKA